MGRGIILACIALLVAMTMTGCQSEEQMQQRRAMDSALRATTTEFNNFYLLGSLPSVPRIRTTMDGLTEAWMRAENTSKSIPGADVSKASAAHKELADAVAGLTEDVDGRIAMETIKPKLEAFRQAVDELAQKYAVKE